MTATPRIILSLFSLVLAILYTVNIAIASASSSSSAEIHDNAETDIMPPSFPSRWGNPPLKHTRDLVQLPGEYGRGSGTLRTWILEKMAEDDAAAAAATSSAGVGSEKSWPDKNLEGMTGEEAKAEVLGGNKNLLEKDIHILPHDAMVTMDYNEERVRIFVGDDGRVVRQPMVG